LNKALSKLSSAGHGKKERTQIDDEKEAIPLNNIKNKITQVESMETVYLLK
jgi:hypothetical protein